MMSCIFAAKEKTLKKSIKFRLVTSPFLVHKFNLIGHFLRRRSSIFLSMELPDGTKVPSKGISPNHSFKAFPLIRSVATMEKIAEDEEVELDNNLEFERKRKILIVEDDPSQARRERRDRRMSERRLSRNMTTTVLQPVTQDTLLFSSPSVTAFHGSSSVSRLARPMSRKDIFFSGSINIIDDPDKDEVPVPEFHSRYALS